MITCKKCGKVYKDIHDFKAKNIQYSLKKKSSRYICECGNDMGEIK
jgi:hypothetical protein